MNPVVHPYGGGNKQYIGQAFYRGTSVGRMIGLGLASRNLGLVSSSFGDF